MRPTTTLLSILGMAILAAGGNAKAQKGNTAKDTSQEAVQTQIPTEKADAAPDDARSEGTLPDEVLRAVVTIKGSTGAGTGFVAKYQDDFVIITNQHVLANNQRLTISDNQGNRLKGTRFVAAGDADIVMILLEEPNPGQAFLQLAPNVEKTARKGDEVMIPGNSQGDGVITITPGKVVALGPKKIEVDNPIYPGNSGSPIVETKNHQVVGILTEATVVTLDPVTAESIKMKDSQIKSEIRYFGHRFDTVERWQALNWRDFQITSGRIATFKHELEMLSNYLFADDEEKNYRDFEELVQANDRAINMLNTRQSGGEKVRAIRDVTRQLRILATRRLKNIDARKLYYTHQQQFEVLKQVSAHIVEVVNLLGKDVDALEKIVY